MRHSVLAILIVLLPVHTWPAQDWVEFTSIEDGFRIAFPGTPQVQSTTHVSAL